MSTGRVVLRALALVTGAAWLFVAFIAGTFTGWSSETLGWLWSGLAFALGLALAVQLWGPRNRQLAFALAGAASVVLGFVHWQSSPPTHDRIADAADEVSVPAGWTLQSDTERGNTWCFKGCPQVDRTYAAPGTYDDALAEATRSFQDTGWKASETPYDTLTFRDGRWSATLIETYPRDDERVQVTLTFTG